MTLTQIAELRAFVTQIQNTPYYEADAAHADRFMSFAMDDLPVLLSAAESELRLRKRVKELEWQKVLLINSLGFIRQRSTTGLQIEGLDSFIDTVLEDPIFHEALDHVSTPTNSNEKTKD